MDTYSSSSSSLYSSRDNQGMKRYHSSLHSIRKPQVKPWKKPIAPLPPTPPKVYKVDPINFRDLVQRLTGAPDQASYNSHHQQQQQSQQQQQQQQQQSQQRLQSIAPPPLELARPALFSRDIVPTTAAAPLQVLPAPANTPFSALYHDLMPDTVDGRPTKPSHTVTASSSLELNLQSPSAWCSYPLLSPGTLASLEQSTVL